MARAWVAWASFLTVVLVAMPVLIGRGCRSPFLGSEPNVVRVRVYLPIEQRILSMPLQDYLVGVVAAEMPPTFADEALKAQMVVARTYTIYNMRRFGGKGCNLNPDADVCGTHEHGQAYSNLATLKERLGAVVAQQYWRRLQAAETATSGLVLTYGGSPIDAVYHSTSGSTTEDAAAVWGRPVPYLRPVPDPWGRTAPRYVDSVSFTPTELIRVLGLTNLELQSPEGVQPVTVLERTPSGRAAKVRVGDRVLSGTELRARLGLRSTQFQIAIDRGQVVLTTYGYGHGVGLSQYGANGLALEGSAYNRILAHYYPGTRLETMPAVG